MKIRTILAAAAAPAALAAVLLGTAGQASAATQQPPQHLTGSVVLAGSAQQFESFNNIGGPGGGTVSYTNYDFASPNSGVYRLGLNGQPVALDFGGYKHTMTVTGINVTGLNSYTFTGTGTYDPDHSYTWNATGSVTGNQLSMHILYTGTDLGYTVDVLNATINPDGSLTGTATDSNSLTLSLAGAAGDAPSVFSFTRPASNVQFNVNGNPSEASFQFTTPPGSSYPNVLVDVDVIDGGSPGAAHDTYKHAADPNPLVTYPVVGGNLTIH